MWSLTYGFLGGVIAWIVTTIIGQPLLRFIQLRNEAAFVLAQYDHRAWIGNPDAKSPDDEWRTKRREAYDATGTALIAFAASNVFVARALRHRILGRFRCYPHSAGESLRTLAKAYPGTQPNEQLRRAVLSGLRINRWPNGIL